MVLFSKYDPRVWKIKIAVRLDNISFKIKDQELENVRTYTEESYEILMKAKEEDVQTLLLEQLNNRLTPIVTKI